MWPLQLKYNQIFHGWVWGSLIELKANVIAKAGDTSED